MPLDQLLMQDKKLEHFFYSLPEYVQETIRERANNMNDPDDVYAYAENFTRGDK